MRRREPSVVTATKRRNKGDYFKTARAKASKRRHLARPAADEVGVPLRNPADASPRLCYLLRHAARHSMAAGSPFQLMTMLPWYMPAVAPGPRGSTFTALVAMRYSLAG